MLLEREAYFPIENVWLHVCPMNPRLHKQKKVEVDPRQSPFELQEEAEVQATEMNTFHAAKVQIGNELCSAV